jgi:hypothetical protein
MEVFGGHDCRDATNRLNILNPSCDPEAMTRYGSCMESYDLLRLDTVAKI